MHLNFDLMFITVIELIFNMPPFEAQIDIQEVSLIIIGPLIYWQFFNHNDIGFDLTAPANSFILLLILIGYDLACKPSLPRVHLDKLFSIEQPLDVLNAIYRIKVGYISTPPCPNAISTIYKTHRDDRYKAFRFNNRSIIFAILKNVFVLLSED